MTDARRIVMVCGAARSGTTMLDLMLGNTARAFSSGEIFCYFRPHRPHHFDPLCSCGDPSCEVWARLKHVRESDFHSSVLAMPGIDYVIDSSKDLRWVINSNEWAAEKNIPVRNVLIWKNPINLAYSHWKRGQPVDYFRRSFIVYHERFLALGLPFVAVNVDRLTANPAEVLGRICARLGMDYLSGQEEFWRKQHHHLFGSAGTGRQVESGSSRVRRGDEFPAEFLQAYRAMQEKQKADARVERLVARLEANDVNAGGETALDSRPVGSTLRPVWYYRHAVKSVFRRYFPETAEIVD